MSSTVHFTIDGRPVAAANGMSILDAALAAGVYIPHLCHHPALPPQGNCRLCAVEIEGREGVSPACETFPEDGMRVHTDSDRLKHLRCVSLELMLASHPHDCTSCKAYLKCELQALLQYTGAVHARMRTVEKRTAAVRPTSPLLVREPERCIQCGRCVRACKDLRGVGVLGYRSKYDETYVGTENDLPFDVAGCRFCGACVAVCPTGALTDAEGIFDFTKPWELALVPCMAECPAHIDIPRYVRAVKDGDWGTAVAVIREKAPFPYTLGSICNHRCETGCKRGKLSEPLAIRELKKYATAHDTDKPWRAAATAARPSTGKHVAIVGAGPCGLTAAYFLRMKGHSVTVFEKEPVAGGVPAWAIPAYRLEPAAVEAEVQLIQDAGVSLRLSMAVEHVATLKRDHDAVLVATGTPAGKKLRLPGAEAAGCYAALDLLRAIKLDLPLALSDTVNIIGGGNVAFDAARSLIRLGKAVNLVCLEEGDAMLADREDIEEARKEGVRMYDGWNTVRIETDGECVTGHRIVKVARFWFDESRALKVENVPNSEISLPCGSIVFAAGQAGGLTEAFGLSLNRFGYPVYDVKTLETEMPGVFAAGDAVTGTRFVIEAVAAGRAAAESIDLYLGGDGDLSLRLAPDMPREPYIGKHECFAALKRNETPFDETAAECEAARCLQCDLRCDIPRVRLWSEYREEKR